MKVIKIITIAILLISGNCYADRTQDIINKIETFFNNTEYKNVTKIIIAQSILETGWYKSPRHNEYNNYWSVKDIRKWKTCHKKPITCMIDNKNLDENIKMMYNYIKRKKYSIEYDGYFVDLIKKKFAEDPKYVWKLKRIIKTMNRLYR